MQPEAAAQNNPYRAPAAAGPARPELEPYRDLRTTCTTLVVLLWMYVGAAGVSSLATVAFYSVGPASMSVIGVTDDATLWGASMILADGMSILVMLGCMILFGRFLYLSNLNARAFGIVPLKYSPASMVWWFFVPIACLFKPYQAVKQVYWASLDPNEPVPLEPPFGAWWGSWILSSIVSNLFFRVPEDAAGAQITLTLILLPLAVASAILAIPVVRAIARQQARTARSLASPTGTV